MFVCPRPVDTHVYSSCPFCPFSRAASSKKLQRLGPVETHYQGQECKDHLARRTRGEDCFSFLEVTKVERRIINHCISASGTIYTVWRLGATAMIPLWNLWVLESIPFSATGALWGLDSSFYLHSHWKDTSPCGRTAWLLGGTQAAVDDGSMRWATLSPTFWHTGQLKLEVPPQMTGFLVFNIKTFYLSNPYSADSNLRHLSRLKRAMRYLD